MITVNINGFLTEFTDGQRQVKVDAVPGTVAETLSQLWKSYEGLRDRVVNEKGQVRPHVNIFLNSDNLRYLQGLQTPVADGAEITILPAVSGGGQ
jgi:molybdopterin synthase sulfur carrier subunit